MKEGVREISNLRAVASKTWLDRRIDILKFETLVSFHTQPFAIVSNNNRCLHAAHRIIRVKLNPS